MNDKLSERWDALFTNVHLKSVVGVFPYPEWGDEIAALEAKLSKMEDWAKLQRQLIADIKDDLGVPSNLAGGIRSAIRELQDDNE